jgi:hypothetical protein
MRAMHRRPKQVELHPAPNSGCATVREKFYNVGPRSKEHLSTSASAARYGVFLPMVATDCIPGRRRSDGDHASDEGDNYYRT